MPLDVLGRTRATLFDAASFNLDRKAWVIFSKVERDGNRSLQFLIVNEEFLVSASHQLALITSLPFVHTARRYYRLNGLVRSLDWLRLGFAPRSDAEKLIELDRLEEVKVVTWFP